MKIICAKEPLLKAVRIAESLLLTKNINKADLVIDASSDITSVFSTDMDTSVIVHLNANISENGAVVVFGKKLSEIISNLPNEDIQFHTNAEHLLKIKSLNKDIKANFSLKGLSKDEYPQIPPFNNNHVFKIDQKDLKNMIRKVITSASNDDTRYVLNGVLFNIKREKIKMVATDGRRLSLISCPIKGLAEEKNVIVSKKVLNEIEKMLGTEGECQVGVTENQIFFRFDNINIVSRLVEGEFPDYQQVIPASFDFSVLFRKEELSTAVKRISLMVNENYKRLNIVLKEKTAVFSGTDPELGDANEEISIKEHSKKTEGEFEISFNSYFLSDVLKVVDGEDVLFQFNKNTNPALIREKETEDYLAVIMPMKSV
jgi:DNA polymerase III subunit beta